MTAQFPLPAPDAPAEEWGRLAASIPGAPECWGDLEGQDGHDAPGAVCADGTWWLPDSADGMFLDVDHPATAGCLLALLTPIGCDIASPGRHRGWRVIVCHGQVNYREGSTLGRACIAAAAALGRWPGGEVMDDDIKRNCWTCDLDDLMGCRSYTREADAWLVEASTLGVCRHDADGCPEWKTEDEPKHEQENADKPLTAAAAALGRWPGGAS